MRYKSIIAATLIGTSFLATTGCKEDFAEVNTKPSAVTKPDVRYLFTNALAEFEPSKYQQWFYNNLAYTMPWAQAVVMEKGNSSSLNLMGAYEGSQSQVVNVKVRTEEINFILSGMEEKDRMMYENIRVMCNPLLVYLGIFGTDMYGSLAYTEAGKVLHSDPPLLTPKYETQEELFALWLDQLDETIEVLLAKKENQVSLGAQDFVYKGNTEKWARFANSLKLKIAVRLLHQNRAKALEIAQQVVNSPAGIMSGINDDFIYCKGAQEYHFGDDVLDGQEKGIGSEELIKLLVNNKDPRVRFLFQKNDFNSKVVQAFLNREKELPPYIKEVADIQMENGKQVFKGWKAPGEPWVRYFGAPVNVYAKDNGAINNAYFNPDNFKLGDKKYVPLCRLNREMLQGQKDYTFPDDPDVSATQDEQDNAWYGLHYSSAEVHLYLAELSLLGAALPQSADYYFQEGIRLSVQEYNKLAELNKIPYYSSVYDPLEATLQLKDGEIEDLLAQPMCKLDGSNKEKLEKVYLQQYIHFLLFPTDQYVQVRRSGVPMRDSKILPWQEFSRDGDANFALPRRFTINTPLPSDLMYEIKKSAYEAQGFTPSTSDPKTLNTERVWYDKGAPNFGEGPNF